MNSRPLLVGSLLLLSTTLLAVPQPAGAAGSRRQVAAPEGADRDGDGRLGEATAIRRRAQLERALRGDGDVLTSEAMLARARWAFERWRERGGPLARIAGLPDLGWVSLGPVNGAGRFTRLAPHPTETGTVLAGAAGGGVWRTTDGGSTWTPLTDDYLPNLSVGALAYAPSDPSVVYLGTGEGGFAIDFIPGIGLVRSLDGGDTWILPATVMASQFFDISVHPQDPLNVLFATSEGLLASTDGGVTWSTQIPKNPSGRSTTEIIPTQIVRSPTNPNTLYTALWCQRECPGGFARVMRTTNGGQSWERAATGLPLPDADDRSVNRAALALAPSSPQTLYIGLNVTASGSEPPPSRIYRTTTGGSSWTETTRPGAYLGFQGWYDNTITVRPTDPTWVVAGGVWYVRSSDSGASWSEQNPYASGANPSWPHVDAHDLEWQGDTLWLANDGGVWKSNDGGRNWIDCNAGLITRQYYGLAIDAVNRERVLAGAQDNGTNRRRDVGDDTWDLVIGGDGFETAINPWLPEIAFGTVYDTLILRSFSGGAANTFIEVSPATGSDETPFLTPLTMRPDAPNVLYTGSTRVWRSEDSGTTWTALSTSVVNGSWNSDEVWSVAVTPAAPAVVMAAKNTGFYRSEDGGASWRLAPTGDAGLPSGKRVVNVEISPWDAAVAFACLAGQSPGHLRRSTDGGLTWHAADTGLPPFTVQVVRFDPTDDSGSTLYAGTDVGLYRSTDGGLTWSRFGDGLPAASVHDIRILPDGSMMRVATHGRGVWELALPVPANRPPTVSLSQPASQVTVSTGDTVELRATVSDPDGDDVASRIVSTDDWAVSVAGSIVGGGPANLSAVKRFDVGGVHRFGVTAADTHGARSSASVQVSVLERADSCSTPRVIPPSGPFPYSVPTGNDSATTAATDPTPGCTFDSGAGRAGSLWFEFTPAESARYALSTCGSLADTVLSVWTGAACGPYTQVSGGCNDDDESVHCAGHRTDSWLELDLAAGTTYRIMVGAYQSGSRGPLRLNVECETCTPPPPSEELYYLVPASAHADGKLQTFWLTDLHLHNPGPADVQAAVAFLAAGADNSSAPQTFFTVPAGASLELQDVVSTHLGTAGAGALRIRADGELVVASRTYNTAAAGTFGQFIAGYLEDTAIQPGLAARLGGLESNAGFRTNIGVANASGFPASAEVDLFDGAGSLLATRPMSIPPYGWLQVTDIFTEQALGAVDNGHAVVRNTSSQAFILTYASIVDSQTGDPTYVAPVAPIAAGTTGWIAASAHSTGVGTSFWQTDVALLSTGVATAGVSLRFFPAGADNSQVPGSAQAVTVQIPAGQSVRLRDIVLSGFGRTTGVGAIAVEVTAGEVMVTSRTYNQAATGTFGQFIPGVATTGAVVGGETATLVQLRRTAGFRTNVGVVNLTGSTIRVRAEYFRADGSFLGDATYEVLPYGFHQQGGAIPGSGDVVGGFARLSLETPGGSFLAYASVVDNGSDDPVFVPAVVVD